MSRAIATLVLCLWALAAAGQLSERFAMVGSFSNATTVNDSTVTVDVTYLADQTGSGYLANQIQPGWRVITSLKKMYRITVVNSASFQNANLTLVRLPGTTGTPFGVGQTYEYDGTTERIPVLPQNNSGLSATFAAMIHTHNVENGGGEGSGQLPDYGTYSTDAEAAAAGVAVGKQYKAGLGNTRGVGLGTVITRIN